MARPNSSSFLAAGARRFAPVGEEAAHRNLQRLGQQMDRMFVLHGFNQRVTLWGGISADKMPNAFFKMSLCWRR